MLAIELSTSSDWAREMRGTASIASTVIGRGGERVDQVGVQRRAEQADQRRAVPQPADLLGRRGVDPQDDVGLPGLVGRPDRGARLGVGVVGEAAGRARPALDDDVVAEGASAWSPSPAWPPPGSPGRWSRAALRSATWRSIRRGASSPAAVDHAGAEDHAHGWYRSLAPVTGTHGVSGSSVLEVLERQPAVDDGRPPLLFVHGLGHGAWCWEKWLDAAAAAGLVGHGRLAARAR